MVPALGESVSEATVSKSKSVGDSARRRNALNWRPTASPSVPAPAAGTLSEIIEGEMSLPVAQAGPFWSWAPTCRRTQGGRSEAESRRGKTETEEGAVVAEAARCCNQGADVEDARQELMVRKA
jgi:hypothetical protein